MCRPVYIWVSSVRRRRVVICRWTIRIAWVRLVSMRRLRWPVRMWILRQADSREGDDCSCRQHLSSELEFLPAHFSFDHLVTRGRLCPRDLFFSKSQTPSLHLLLLFRIRCIICLYRSRQNLQRFKVLQNIVIFQHR